MLIIAQFVDLFPVEVALTLGIVCFALSWIRPRRIVELPTGSGVDAGTPSRRQRILLRTGVAGSLGIVVVATITTTLAFRFGFPDPSGFGGWWRRPAPLVAAAIVCVLVALALRRDPAVAAGERAILPHRRWWSDTSRPLLWTTVAVAALLALIATWQTAIGRTAPEGANLFGNVPDPTELPVYLALLNDYGFVAGAGWPNHLATLLALLLAAIAYACTLGADTHRAVRVPVTATARREREATARMLTLISLGALVITLGGVCAHTGFIGEIVISMGPRDGEATYLGAESGQAFVGTGYQSIAPLLHRGGYVLQGLGVALLLRIAVDTLRSWRQLPRDRRSASAPRPGTAGDGQAAAPETIEIPIVVVTAAPGPQPEVQDRER